MQLFAVPSPISREYGGIIGAVTPVLMSPPHSCYIRFVLLEAASAIDKYPALMRSDGINLDDITSEATNESIQDCGISHLPPDSADQAHFSDGLPPIL